MFPSVFRHILHSWENLIVPNFDQILDLHLSSTVSDQILWSIRWVSSDSYRILASVTTQSHFFSYNWLPCSSSIVVTTATTNNISKLQTSQYLYIEIKIHLVYIRNYCWSDQNSRGVEIILTSQEKWERLCGFNCLYLRFFVRRNQTS